MNQILDYGENDQKTSSNQEDLSMQSKTMEDYYQKPDKGYSPNVNFSSGSKDNKKTIKIFAIALGIFAFISLIIAVGIFLVTNKAKKELPKVEQEKPEILMVENEKTIEVTATYKDSLDKLVYSWGENLDQTVPGTGLNTISASIEKPIGTYVLTVIVYAQDGNEATEKREYTQESGPDLEKPTIDFQITDTKKLKITVRDNVEIKSFKYYWNEDSPTELADAAGRPEASVVLNILKGRNKITVIVVDKAGNEKVEEKEYTGKVAPEISMYVTSDKKSVMVTVKHELGLSEVITILNGVEDKKTYEGDLIKPEIKLQVTLKPGENILEVKATSVDDETASTIGSAQGPAVTETQVLRPEP